MATEIDIAVTTTTYDVVITATPNEYIVNITTGGSGGVQTVTGTTVDNTDPLNPVVEVPNLTQVVEQGDLLIGNSGIGSNTFLTLQLGVELTENYFNTSGVGTGGIFLDKDIIFPDNSTIRFQAGFAEDGGGSVTLDSYKFTTDAHVYYQGAEVTDITIQPDDVCMLKCAGLGGDGAQVWLLTVTNKSSGGGGTWGSITGTLSAQTDLQTALDAKVDKVAGSRLIASAESTLLGNTSGTNSGDNATNSRYEVVARTGAVIAFDTDAVYNSIASPSSSNLTDDLTGARLKIVQKIYHNAGTAPTVPAGWVKKGTGNYVTSTLNTIYAEWSVGTTVEYWITQ